MKDNHVSITAFVIAFAVVILGGDEYGRQRLPPGTILKVQKDLLATVLSFRRPYLYPPPSSSSWFWSCYWCLWCNPCFSKLVRWYMQGSMWMWGGRRRRVLETIGYRKTFMEDCVRRGMEEANCQQVLIIGGGFDTLALRLSELFPLIHFWEVDHPATGQLKRQAIQQLLSSSSSSRERTNLHFVPIDLAKTRLTPEILSNVHEYHVDAPTVVIIEGVLMYLTELQVIDLLQQLADMVGPASLLAFDFVEGDENDTRHVPSKTAWGPIRTPIMLWILQHVLHEPWLWGIPPQQFPKFVDERLSKWKCCGENSTTDVVHAAGVVYTTKLQKR